VTFSDSRYLVTIIRSPRFLTAAVAAAPLTQLEQRYREIAERLVPAGMFAGLAAAAALLLLARQQMSLAAALRTGLRRHQFYLEYQPMIELRSGACVGVEALLRWRDGAGELVPPDVFIPVAETNGMIGSSPSAWSTWSAATSGGSWRSIRTSTWRSTWRRPTCSRAPSSACWNA
jgi:sensor c-di-GMP phosphodiesterase-like protein